MVGKKTPENERRLAVEYPSGAVQRNYQIRYSEEAAEEICRIVATHCAGINTLAKLYPHIPHPTTIARWRLNNKEFDAKYFAAKQRQAELMIEEMDDFIPGDINYIEDEKGQRRIDPPSATLLIAKLNNRKWTAARLAPKKYGDRMAYEEVNPTKDTLDKIQELVSSLQQTPQKDE